MNEFPPARRSGGSARPVSGGARPSLNAEGGTSVRNAWYVASYVLVEAVLTCLLALSVTYTALLRAALLSPVARRTRRSTEQARAALRRRYLAGEIGCEEFWRVMSGFPAE
jgi:uncharacterized membrane protein